MSGHSPGLLAVTLSAQAPFLCLRVVVAAVAVARRQGVEMAALAAAVVAQF